MLRQASSFCERQPAFASRVGFVFLASSITRRSEITSLLLPHSRRIATVCEVITRVHQARDCAIEFAGELARVAHQFEIGVLHKHVLNLEQDILVEPSGPTPAGRAWFRFTLKWTDPDTGETRTLVGMQVYRIEAGMLAETWLMFQPVGSAWRDAVAQEHWTSPPPIK